MGFRSHAKPFKYAKAAHMKERPTQAEAILKDRLWDLKKTHGLKFRTQCVMFGWIVDFWLPSRKLVIECDGPYHGTDEQRQKDAIRDVSILWKLGAKTLRFSNEQVINETDWVISEIIREAIARPVFKGCKSGKNVPA